MAWLDKNKIMYHRTCKNCGKEFEYESMEGLPEKFLKKCCSDECSREYTKKLRFVYCRTTKKGLPREDVESMSCAEFDAYIKRLGNMPAPVLKAVCECCGKDFEYDVRHAGFGHKRKYCSEECMVKGVNARVARERHEKSNHEVECVICHKKFWSIYPTAKYCSKECKLAGSHPDVYLNPDGTRKEKQVFERECPECGKAFQTDNSKKRFCSDSCRRRFSEKKNASPKKTVVRTCRQCGKEFSFEVSETSSEKFWPKCCSDECRSQWKAAHPDTFQWQDKPKKEPKTLVCERCGKEFVTTRYSGRNAQKFCSKECRAAAIYDRMLISHRKPQVTIKCEVCGKEFEIPQGANRKYCSKACKRAAEYRKKGYVPKDPIEKTCKQCGKAFLTRNSMQLYCSKECREAYHAVHPEPREYEKKVFEPKTCEICGKVFTPKSKTQVTCGDPECKRKLNLKRSAERRNREWVESSHGPRECSHCHQTFVPDKHHPHQKYCSKKCQSLAEYARRGRQPSVPPQPRECAHCGKVFTPDYLHPKQKYCSKKCQYSAQYARHKALNPLSLPEPRACKHCGKVFTPDYRHSNQKYCSRECQMLAAGKWSKKVEKTCVICGKTFMGYAYQKTCSKECSYKNRSSWRGGSETVTVTVKAVCKNCGKEFEYVRRGRQLERRYCSEKCSKDFWNKYMTSLKADLMADPEYAAKREAEKRASRQERLDRLAAVREEKAKAKAELREKIAAMRAMEKERRAVEREKLRDDFKARRALERLEKALAAEEAREKAKAEREAAMQAERVRKKAERDAAKAEARKKREEERNARILANREKRRLVKEENARLRKERWEKIRLNPEEAEKLAKTAAERRLASRVACAAKARAATRAREYAEHLACIEKARSEGKEIRKSVCKECGQEFEYIVEEWKKRRYCARAIGSMMRSGKTEADIRKWIKTPPEFCTKGCQIHWRYEHGGRERVKKLHQKQVEAGAYWNGRKFVIPKKQETIVSRWIGSGNFYASQSAGSTYSVATYADRKYAGLEDYPIDTSWTDQQDEAGSEANEAAEAKSFLDD